MLNELYDLSKSLDRLGVEVVSWHRFLKECPRGKSFFVDLGRDSNVTAIRPITDPDRLSNLRKYEKAAGYSFPSFNILPLWQFDEEQHRETAAKLRKSMGSKKRPPIEEASQQIAELVAVARSCWVDPNKKSGGRDAMDKVNGCVGSIVDDVAAIVEVSDTKASAPLHAIIERAKLLDGEQLHNRLSAWLVEQFAKPSDNSVTWFDLLFFASGKKPKSFSVVLELSEQHEFEYPVNHPAVFDHLNNCLQGSDASASDNSKALRPDAFAATDGGREKSFPTVKMSRFGNINIRAMSRESLCQVRYGVAESKSFPVAQTIRQQCKNALEWISRDQRKDVTWCDITSISGSPSILFAYPSHLPEQIPALAFLLNGDEDPTSLQTEGQFEACAETIAKALSGRKESEGSKEIVIFVLAKPDGFRTKVLYSHRCSESHLIKSAEDWQHGCLNIPEIQVRQFGREKGDKPQWRTPLIPFTTEIIGCLNTVWLRQGTHASSCKTVGVADSLSILLDHGETLNRTASNLLEVTLKNTIGLMLAVGQASRLGRVHAVARNQQKHQLLIPRILGLLLWKLGIPKGDYMKTPAFWVGRMLGLADQLHLQYCYHVRKGEIPPQLVGNSLMSTALSTPEHALSVLAERMRPYQAWAQTVHTGENVGLAKYLLSHLSAVSIQLAELDIPTRTNDSDRATMLLGYLSRPAKDTRTTNGENENDDSDQE
ncbi:hypothetical protein CA13_63740 [Planctomycetes bacterium CA13]|uniref:CRISPR-associated protein n=1 Tax=Novipirellula herctigrandis TaxID=2527986 RepID=A0A5C5ZED2_9BACT|nr:hypothetical protein CA13_63740 [Planctomycetes bacterium CA13]